MVLVQWWQEADSVVSFSLTRFFNPWGNTLSLYCFLIPHTHILVYIKGLFLSGSSLTRSISIMSLNNPKTLVLNSEVQICYVTLGLFLPCKFFCLYVLTSIVSFPIPLPRIEGELWNVKRNFRESWIWYLLQDLSLVESRHWRRLQKKTCSCWIQIQMSRTSLHYYLFSHPNSSCPSHLPSPPFSPKPTASVFLQEKDQASQWYRPNLAQEDATRQVTFLTTTIL